MKKMNAVKKLLFPSTMVQAGWDVLKAREDVQALPFEYGMPTAGFHALLRDAQGVALGLTPFGEAEALAAPNLKVVARHGVGYDTVDVAALTRHKIPLMIAGTANSASVAEQALYFMLTLAKRGAAMDAMVRERRWAERLAGELPCDLYGKTVLVIGFGRTGSRLARMCRGLEMNVRVYDPYVAAHVVTAAGCERTDDLDAALPGADFVAIHCPRTPETENMFDAARLKRMKPTAFLVNTARGGIIDEAALHTALTQGTIRGAGLDVFDREPPSPDNPLPGLLNLVTAPHMAGVTRESLDRMAVATARNILDYLDGHPNPDHIVNPQAMLHR
jgi:D-3-phosphoglycerate dehydrogenase / 2-oxoglutarate reductase